MSVCKVNLYIHKSIAKKASIFDWVVQSYEYKIFHRDGSSEGQLNQRCPPDF